MTATMPLWSNSVNNIFGFQLKPWCDHSISCIAMTYLRASICQFIISGFFEKLWNRIWWCNENGESEYVKPTISNKLLDILATLQDYQEKLKSTIDTIGSAASDVANYISAGTSFVNGVVGVAGAGFTVLIVFGIVFVLVRKVVGR